MTLSSFRRAAWALVLLSLTPSAAFAGPVEQFVQVLLNDAAPERIAVRYDQTGGGLLVSDDGGESFSLLCSAVIGAEVRPHTALMAGDGSLWVGWFDGLAHDDGAACGWSMDATFRGRWVSDIVQQPSRPHVLFAVTGAAAPEENGMYRREGSAAFERFGGSDAAMITRLRIAERPNGPLRFYQSIVRGTRSVDLGAGPTTFADYRIRFSDDGGAHWTEHEYPATSGTVRLEAVDPANVDRILISVTLAGSTTTLYISEDAGATFAPYLELGSLGGLSIAPDGRVFIGDGGAAVQTGAKGGLYRAASLREAPVLLTDAYAVQCLGYRRSDDRLFACQRYAFGVADQNDGAFRALLKLNDIEQMVQCADRDVQAVCQAPLLQGYCGATHFPCAPVCEPYALDACGDPQVVATVVDAGMPAAVPAQPERPIGAADGGESKQVKRKRYGCALVPTDEAPAGGSFAAVVALSLIGLCARRRR